MKRVISFICGRRREIYGYLWCLQAPFLSQVPLTHSKVHSSIIVLLTSSPNLTPSCSRSPPPSLATFLLLTQLFLLCFLFALLCSCFSHYDFSILSFAIHPPLSHRQPWPCTVASLSALDSSRYLCLFSLTPAIKKYFYPHNYSMEQSNHLFIQG